MVTRSPDAIRSNGADRPSQSPHWTFTGVDRRTYSMTGRYLPALLATMDDGEATSLPSPR
jgi:hypothetical protein